MTKSSDILIGAAKILEDGKWRQGSYGNEDVGFCAFGAMDAYCYRHVPSDREDLAEDALKMFKEVANKNLVKYNDTTGRTKEEVITKMREVASELILKGN